MRRSVLPFPDTFNASDPKRQFAGFPGDDGRGW
jgi:hypothetical protein